MTTPDPDRIGSMAQAIADARDLETALGEVIRYLDGESGWLAGEAWQPCEQGHQLEFNSWFPESNFENFSKTSRGYTFALGAGLPGRVWQSGQPEWIADLTRISAEVYHRIELAKQAGLKAAFGVPLFHKDSIQAIVVIYASEPREFDDSVATTLTTIGPQLVSVLKRAQLEEQLRSSQRNFREGKRFYQALIEHGQDIITLLDAEGTIRYESPSVQPLLGYAPEELIGEPAFNYVHPNDQKAIQTALVELLSESERTNRMDFRFRAKNGAWHVLEGIAQNRTHDPVINGIVVNSRDVTDRRDIERQLEQSESKYRNLFEQSQDGVFITALDGRIVDINPAGAEMFGFTREELIDEDVRTVYERPEERHRFQTEIARRGFVRDFELTLRRRDGSPRHCLLTAHVRRDDDGTIIGYQGIVRDVTEWRRMQEQLAYLAHRDPLTGLKNRRSFEEELDQKVAEASRHGGNGVVLWIDIDRFKEINDIFGHQAGDEVLGNVASRLSAVLREGDVLARIGGDEFAVLIPQAQGQQAELVANKLLSAVDGLSTSVADHSLRVTVSIGGAHFPEHGTTSDTVLASADLSMYKAKEAGRNCYRMLGEDENWHEQLTLTLDRVREIRDSLEKDRFIFHSQPIMDLSQGDIHGAELLLRMRRETEVILPGAFLETATEFGLIADIDRWVAKAAIRLLSQRQRAGDRTCLEVNLSAKAIEDETLLELIESELTAYRVDPTYLTFEITETDAISHIDQAKRFITRLKDLGCQFALDDFGVGFSSFYHLKHLPVDYLKIDGGFVRDLPNDPVDQHLVRAMIEIARALSIQTVAEFVEDEATLQLLKDFGVDYAQGFYIGRPQPVL